MRKPPIVLGATDVGGILNSYSEYLHGGHMENAKRFDAIRVSDREQAVAEAVVFAMLQGLNVDPQISDDLKSGGADFICCAPRSRSAESPPQRRFVVKAASLSPEAVVDPPKRPNRPPDETDDGEVGLITRNIRDRAKDKATQLGCYRMPRVLAIASGHLGVAGLFSGATATSALVSDERGKREKYTELDESVFMKPGPDGKILACRKSLSAILLVAVHGSESQVWGILHPKPDRPFDIAFLPDLPFVRVAKWPIDEGRIRTEWIISSPYGSRVHHFPVRVPAKHRVYGLDSWVEKERPPR